MTDIQVENESKIFTVSEITRNIRFALEAEFSSVVVEGEISNFVHHSSGHMYFSLKDEQASLNCVMFRQENLRLRFKPESGMRIICRGRVSIYAQRGQVQLVVSLIEPQGVGDLQIAFEQLKKKLSQEGLFDASRKKPIPFMPLCIGIITSPTGAVIRDMLHIFNRRHPGAHLVIRPTAVQGNGAGPDLVRALSDFNEYGKPDVLVLARGGGSLEDLWGLQ